MIYQKNVTQSEKDVFAEASGTSVHGFVIGFQVVQTITAYAVGIKKSNIRLGSIKYLANCTTKCKKIQKSIAFFCLQYSKSRYIKC